MCRPDSASSYRGTEALNLDRTRVGARLPGGLPPAAPIFAGLPVSQRTVWAVVDRTPRPRRRQVGGRKKSARNAALA
ncbi:hypothetical protein PR003_g15316 [Phytophthora rubi]|uniref:Uncharacterized protein n=1 Tax=Phytophthora rubi TaxID=129364 RepID=A0A6A3N1Q6_9STRA|nr:hypothetical protein PR001_g15139 [Phytophthora rubi]KAE9039413.1 hypothetical protein PR002_g5513 [Phytophthora rubi]KAE9330398.1 hypothetical protein PR003_g15316 [Phytophthora rubi]